MQNMILFIGPARFQISSRDTPGLPDSFDSRPADPYKAPSLRRARAVSPCLAQSPACSVQLLTIPEFFDNSLAQRSQELPAKAAQQPAAERPARQSGVADEEQDSPPRGQRLPMPSSEPANATSRTSHEAS